MSTKTGSALGLSTTEVDRLPDLEQGEGLWRIGERSFMVRHTCTPGELDLFDTNARMFANARESRDLEPKMREPKGRCSGAA